MGCQLVCGVRRNGPFKDKSCGLVSPMYCLKIRKEVVALYHVNVVFRVTVEVMSEGSGFTCMRFVRQLRPRALGTKKIS